MMNAYSLPTSVEAGGQVLHIRANGDWRVIVDVNIALTDTELTDAERVMAAMAIFYDIDNMDDIKDPDTAAQQMVAFISAGEPEGPQRSRPKLVDWQDDAALIVSGVNKVLQTEVRAQPYMHWWTFIAAYMAIGDSMLATVVSIRDKVQRGKKLEKHEQEFRRENPQYFTRKRDAEAAHTMLLELIDE